MGSEGGEEREDGRASGVSPGTGSPEYPDGTPEYPAEIGDGPPDGETRAEGAVDELTAFQEERFARADQVPAVDENGKVAWWSRAGYATFGDYLREAEALNDLHDPFAQQRKARERVERAMPGRWAPAGRPDVPRVADELKRSRQVGVKLNVTEHHALARVAEVYGTTPAAMARMLINRGTQSIVASLEGEAGEARG